jgi:hypothetical protein
LTSSSDETEETGNNETCLSAQANRDVEILVLTRDICQGAAETKKGESDL